MIVELYRHRFIRLRGSYGFVIKIAKRFVVRGARCVVLCGAKRGGRSRATVVMEV